MSVVGLLCVSAADNADVLYAIIVLASGVHTPALCVRWAVPSRR
jgi:hypothetical protein